LYVLDKELDYQNVIRQVNTDCASYILYSELANNVLVLTGLPRMLTEVIELVVTIGSLTLCVFNQ